MKAISIFNDVIGPVMRGPSSSHTAGAYHLASLAKSLLGEEPAEARFAFDPDGSYSRTYREQGADLAFVMGLLGLPMTDVRFRQALELAPSHGLMARFATETLPEADHPNTVRICLKGRGGRELHAVGRSIGGGAVEMTSLEGWPLLLNGKFHDVAVEVEVEGEAQPEVARLLSADGQAAGEIGCQSRDGRACYHAARTAPLPGELRTKLETMPGVRRLWQCAPIFFVKRGEQLFSSAAELVRLAEAQNLSAGQIALKYESQLLGLSESETLAETVRRFEVMLAAVHAGLAKEVPSMQLLRPSAASVYTAEAEGRLFMGGIHTRAAARAMAAMHVNCGMGVVCAAPTAGSAGVLPGVLTSLHEDRNLDRQRLAYALLAAGVVGLVLAERATFAAEIAGCQVEIGAAGAMAAAAVVEVAGGTARQAMNAAAISFQNTMGLVCDLVQGIVEIPCHTRNAVAASSAFVCADLVLGGYENPIPLDETIDAVYAVGKVMPRQLRVTSLGGLAVTPSALALKRLK